MKFTIILLGIYIAFVCTRGDKVKEQEKEKQVLKQTIKEAIKEVLRERE